MEACTDDLQGVPVCFLTAARQHSPREGAEVRHMGCSVIYAQCLAAVFAGCQKGTHHDFPQHVASPSGAATFQEVGETLFVGTVLFGVLFEPQCTSLKPKIYFMLLVSELHQLARDWDSRRELHEEALVRGLEGVKTHLKEALHAKQAEDVEKRAEAEVSTSALRTTCSRLE